MSSHRHASLPPTIHQTWPPPPHSSPLNPYQSPVSWPSPHYSSPPFGIVALTELAVLRSAIRHTVASQVGHCEWRGEEAHLSPKSFPQCPNWFYSCLYGFYHCPVAKLARLCASSGPDKGVLIYLASLPLARPVIC